MRLIAAAFTGALVAVVVAGCGGGGRHLSHATFVQRANAICQTVNAQLRALPPPASAATLGPFIRKALPLEQSSLARLKKIEPPRNDESNYDLFLGQLQRQITTAQNELAPALQAPSNRKHVQFILTKLAGMEKHTNALAQKIGLSRCAQPSAG